MEIRLSEDLRNRVEQELGSGGYRDFDEFVEEAVRYFLEDRQRGQRRRDALRRIGQAVDEAGLYERVLLKQRAEPNCG